MDKLQILMFRNALEKVETAKTKSEQAQHALNWMMRNGRELLNSIENHECQVKEDEP